MDGLEVKTNYRVKDNEDVFLSLKIGDGQLGTHLIELDFDPVGDGNFVAPQDNFKIGKGSEIKSKTLFVTSTISNNKSSENASITYSLIGGFEPKDITISPQFNGRKAILVEAEFQLI